MRPRLNDKFTRLAALRPAPSSSLSAAAQLSQGADAEALALLVGATPQRNRYGEHLLVRRWYPEPAECAELPRALQRLVPEATEESADPSQWLFLDTETTGLAGGTGTYAFLVGVGWWDAGGLQVEQFFMRDHSEEHSLLVALAERLAERRVLVTFNGKSFDWPLLETRYRMTRSIAAKTPRAHLDLLHPARNLWRMRLGSVRLIELERQILAPEPPGITWQRDADIPGALIPQAYFDYLRGGSPGMLASVFTHNQMDLRGLASLAGKMLSLLDAPESADGDALDLFGISRLLRRRGESALARHIYERALSAGLPAKLDRAARRELAALAKREKDFSRATELWQELAGVTPPHTPRIAHEQPLEDGTDSALEAYEQLAIYYEHHAREPERAAALTRDALAALGSALRGGYLTAAAHRKLRARLEHRLHRLERRFLPGRGPLLDAAANESSISAVESNNSSTKAEARDDIQHKFERKGRIANRA